jgi:predicted RNase H-like nuclease (RuvC/YqgF family)
MENEHRSEFGTQSTKSETKADKEWSEFERDLESLGRQLAELQIHTAALGTQLVRSLEAGFEEVKHRAERFRKEREVEIEEMRRRATSEAENSFADMRQRSTEAARQMWERAEPLRQGAKDVGEGLGRAWVELRASFGKAAGRLQTETDANGTTPAPATSDERRERT